MASKIYTIEGGEPTELINELPPDDRHFVKVTDSRTSRTGYHVGQMDVALFFDGKYHSRYFVDSWEEGEKVALYTLHGLREEADDPDLERLKREIASGERGWMRDADDVRKAGPMSICVEHRDGDSKVQLVFKDPLFWESEEGSGSFDRFELGEYE